MSVASLTPRVREALSVSSSYDEETIPAAIRRAIQRLLRDYNFPKSIKRRTYDGLTEGQQSFAVPEGFKALKSLRFFDPVDLAWGDRLGRRESFMMPSGDGVPRRYWLEGTKLWIDTPVSGDYTRTQLQLFYQTMLVADCEDWMTEDFEDVLFTLTVYREAAGQFRKPEVSQAFGPLWGADQQSIARYAHELEFDDLEMVQREQTWRPAERYPVYR